MATRYESLKDKVVIVTGGATGIGKQTALMLGEEGARVVVVARSEKTGEAVAEEIRSKGGQALFVRCDVGSEEDVKAMVARAVEVFGGVDLAFNNAGIGPDGVRIPFCPLTDLPVEDFDAQVRTNLRGVFLCMKYELIQMKAQGRGGAIVNTSSVGGIRMVPNFGAYGPTKAAINAMTQTAALENGPFGIRVNSVCPGPTLGTVLMDNNIASGEERGKKNAPGSFAPLRKPGQTEDVANAVLWLLSDKAGHVTGLAVPVDGGIHAM